MGAKVANSSTGSQKKKGSPRLLIRLLWYLGILVSWYRGMLCLQRTYLSFSPVRSDRVPQVLCIVLVRASKKGSRISLTLVSPFHISRK